MGFLHQLHLLLWKNVTLKRRSPWVLAFEIFIPLVLFFILLGLRQKKPTIPVKEGESRQGGAWGAPTLGGTLRLWGDAPAWGQGGPREAFWETLHWAGAAAKDWWGRHGGWK